MAVVRSRAAPWGLLALALVLAVVSHNINETRALKVPAFLERVFYTIRAPFGERTFKNVVREFITDCVRAAILISKDKRMKYAYAFDALMAVGALGCHFVVDGMLGECGKVACIYFLLVGTLSAYSYVAMDRGDIVHISVADNIGKLSLLLIGVATIALLVHVLSTVLEDKQRNQAAANKKRQEQEEEVKVGLTSRLAQDVMACKKGAPGLLKLLELDRSALHGYSPEDISEELSVAIRGLCSFVKLANATILASEVPIQILYEKHILDKEVAIAFHTMDDGHKKVMAATARLLEEYFTRGDDDEEEEEGERESSKDK